MWVWLLMGIVSALLAGCSGQFWVNELTPWWGYTRYTDIAYGKLDRQTLDVYVPDKLAKGAPVVVFFYGGSWQTGDKSGYRFVGEALASKGFIAILPNYRLYPPTTFPGFVKDGAGAAAWTYHHAADYGGNPCHLLLMGHSAGAYIAGMLAADTSYLRAAGLSVKDIAGFIGMAGPYNFLPISDPSLQEIFAPKSAWQVTQPINFVNGNEPPMLLMHGDNDHTVAVKNSRNMAEKVNATGGYAELKIYPGKTHVSLIAPLAAPLRFLGPQLSDIAAFVNAMVVNENCDTQ